MSNDIQIGQNLNYIEFENAKNIFFGISSRNKSFSAPRRDDQGQVIHAIARATKSR